MPRNGRYSDSGWDDEGDDSDDEYDPVDEYGPDDPSSTTGCIQCGCEIYDDASRCPLCGEYQVGDRSLTAWEGRPLWWKVGGLLGIIAVLFGLLGFWL